jgi:hypothetical protein
MSKMTKRPIRYTIRLTMQWTRGGGHVGVCTPRLVLHRIYPFFTVSFFSVLFSREARENAEVAKHRAERPKIQLQFADLKRGLSVVTDEEWEGIPEVGNLTRKKRRRDERSFGVPDSVIVGDRSKIEYENSLDSRQQVSTLALNFRLKFIILCRLEDLRLQLIQAL